MKEDSKHRGEGDYITSNRAAQLSGYSQDYVGQLCRGASIECKRVSGEWHVALPALLAYKKRFSPERDIIDQNVSTAVSLKTTNGHQEVIEGTDGIYISSSDAAKRTGYSQDYIGQLARSGAVSAKKVGRKWFIGQDSLEQHKSHNDNLLSAVQANSVGIASHQDGSQSLSVVVEAVVPKISTIPIVTYKHDDGSLVPGSATPTPTQSVHAPEVHSMPVNAVQAKAGRRDMRSRPISLQNMSQYRAENRVKFLEQEPVFTESTTDIPVSIFPKIAFSLIIALSIAAIAGSLLAPERFHKYALQASGAVGITLESMPLQGTNLGKKTLGFASVVITYKKEN